jgi:lipoprotein-anchoring transpeptidase ErfK/SrfK
MKKFVLSTLACLIANQAFAATNTVSETTTAKTAPATKAVTKKTTTTKTATTKAASASTAAATVKKTTTDSKTATKSQSKTATAKKPQTAKPAANVTQSTTTPKVASAAAATAVKPTATSTDIPLTPVPATTTALGIKDDANQTGIDNDYTSGAGVAGASSEEINTATTAAPTFDPTTVGSNKTATTPASFSNLNLSEYAQLVNSADWKPGQNVNSATTLKLQALLDWNHASPGPIDGGWGMNAKKALKNFQAMHGLPQDGRMNAEVWKLLNEKIPANQPVLVGYTLTQEDIKGPYQPTPSGSEAKSKMKGLYYQDVQEMLAERFHMDIRYLKKLNADKKFTEGETITVFNPGAPLNEKITHLVAKKADNILYAYNGDRLIATYPTTVGSSDTPSPTGSLTIVNRVKNPWYRASSGEGKDKKVFMLPPGPNGPVGVVWMGLSKPSYGIHGSPVPEGISRQASHGCVRLTNWDVLEVYANVDTGTKVDLQ